MNGAITSLSLTNVRCFAGVERAKLAKITLLVGENSAGKSTFLGCLAGLGYLAGLNELNDQTNCFDRAPFSMGSFQNIVRSGCKSFRVGIGLKSDYFRKFEIEFEEGSISGLKETVLELQLTKSLTGAEIDLRIARHAGTGQVERWCFDGSSFQFELDQSELSYFQFSTWISRLIRQGTLPFHGDPRQYRKWKAQITDQELAEFSKFINFFRHQFRVPKIPLSLKPTSPKALERKRFFRFDPLGIADGKVDVEAVTDLGNSLGLFRQIEVRERSPQQYEVLVDVYGGLHNLADVGYGVSGILPLILDLVKAPAESLFLLQQPEVHIHPSAQAKLVEILAKTNHRYVIETHSDHVIDWFRILATEGDLSPSDVAIVYFERLPENPSASHLFQLSLDEDCKLTGQPKNYRQFFSEETLRLLGLPI